MNKNALILDGDELRKSFMDRFDYSKNERIFLGKAYLNIAVYLSNQNIEVIVSTVSLFSEIHEYIASNKYSKKIKIIFINPRQEILNLRNQKNLRSGNVHLSPGIDLEINFPVKFDLELTGEEDDLELVKSFEELFLNE